jgi:putative protein-disulfide isomerase
LFESPKKLGMVSRMPEPSDRELLYIGDPMCSWCWGISAELDKLVEQFPGVSFRILTGGLRTGSHVQELTDEFVQFLAVEWSEVNARTGQPVDFGILQREDWVYDTEPACRAVTVMGEIDESLAWPLFKRIQQAFYAEGVVVTDPDVYPDLVRDVAGDPDKFMAMFLSKDAVELVRDDFALVRSWGITSFPTVILRQGDSGTIIAQGYATAEEMAAEVEELA